VPPGVSLIGVTAVGADGGPSTNLDVLLGALLRRARSSAPPVSPSRIEAYYAGHRRRYDRTRPASARRAIALTLAEQDRRQAADRFLSAFRRRQRARTACARDFSVPSCGRTTPG
jgi:hypothetical protein